MSRSTQSATLVTSSAGGFCKNKCGWLFVENPQLQNQKKSWIILESSAYFILIHIERLLHELLCIFLCQLRDLGAGKETSTLKAGKSEKLCKWISAWLKTGKKINPPEKRIEEKAASFAFNFGYLMPFA